MSSGARRQLRRKRHKLVQQYETRCHDRLSGKSGVMAVKVAPGDKPGFRSMGRGDYEALKAWIADYRRTVMDIKPLLLSCAPQAYRDRT